MSQPFHNLCFHFYFCHVFSSHLGSIHWKVSIVLGVRKQGQWGCLLRSDCLATHLPSSKDRGYLHFGKKVKSSPSPESRGRNILLTTPQRNLPFSANSPWVAFLCLLCCVPSPRGGLHLLRGTQSCWGQWVPSGSTRTGLRTSWSHSSGLSFPTLLFPFVAFFPGNLPHLGDV